MIRTLRFLACVVLVSGCRKNETVPCYVEIPAVTVSATDEQGGNTSKITDAWVSVNDRSLGVWELPARIPVIGTGIRTISVTPSVKRNGTFDDRLRYPYYTTWKGPVDLSAEETRTLSPVVAYETITDFWLEQFADAGNRFTVAENSDTTLELFTAQYHPEVLLDGTSCGGFTLDPSRDQFAMFTNADFSATTGPVFVELDYSTDVELTIGFLFTAGGVPRSEPWVKLVPTASEGAIRWNKVYIDVSTFFNTAGITQLDIYLGTTLPTGRTIGRVFIDNFKLLRSGS